MDEEYTEQFQPAETPEPPNAGKDRSGFLRLTLDFLETIVLSVLLFIGINAISARIRVDGPSMEPTLASGEFVLVNKLAYKIGSPKLGDVIVFQNPQDVEENYIKRVIGLPGDQVTIQNGQVIVNDEPIAEPYVTSPPAYQQEGWIVPEDALFVLGDNRNNSSDSHNWGPVPIENVIGKAVFVYWPPRHWGTIGATAAASPSP